MAAPLTLLCVTPADFWLWPERIIFLWEELSPSIASLKPGINNGNSGRLVLSMSIQEAKVYTLDG